MPSTRAFKGGFLGADLGGMVLPFLILDEGRLLGGMAKRIRSNKDEKQDVKEKKSKQRQTKNTMDVEVYGPTYWAREKALNARSCAIQRR